MYTLPNNVCYNYHIVRHENLEEPVSDECQLRNKMRKMFNKGEYYGPQAEKDENSYFELHPIC